MPRPHIPNELRSLIIERAQERCEYCRLHRKDTYLPHHIDHIISIKHRGQTTSDNLAFACVDCNRFKGSDLTTYDPISGKVTPLFNPRIQNWDEHFMLDGAQIIGLTPIGRATVSLLRLNDAPRVAQRQWLMDAGRYPRQ